jgi:ferredoxin
MYSKRLSLRFPKKIVNEAIAVNLVKKFDLSFNILKATIYPRKEGLMVLDLSGHRKNFQRGVRYLKGLGIKVESIGQDIKRIEEKCFQCGACTAVCPTGALYIKRPEMEVIFDRDKCSACELCVSACPARAMKVRFDKSLLY